MPKRSIDLDLLPDITLSQLQQVARAFGLKLDIEVLLEEAEPPVEPFVIDLDFQPESAPEPTYDEKVKSFVQDVVVPEVRSREAAVAALSADDQPGVTCLNPECRKVLEQKPRGRKRMYCDGKCKSRSSTLRAQADAGALPEAEPTPEPAPEVPAAQAGPTCPRSHW
jgi:hypothetical protein